MNVRINKQLLPVYAGILLVILFLLIVIYSFFLSKPSVGPTSEISPTGAATIPSPTLNPLIKNNPETIESGPAYEKSVSQIDKENKEFLSRESAVAGLLSKLPHKGIDFSMSYDIRTNRFTVVIESSNKATGDQEFDTFLKQNKIDNESWIRNLTITYQ